MCLHRGSTAAANRRPPLAAAPLAVEARPVRLVLGLLLVPLPFLLLLVGDVGVVVLAHLVVEVQVENLKPDL